MRVQDWVFLGMIVAAVFSFAMLVTGNYAWAGAWGVLTFSFTIVARIWSKKRPGPMSHAISWMLLIPRPYHSWKNLKQLLEPKAGENLLEIGPGIGFHSLPAASALVPGGRLEVVDVQQEMLDDLLLRARKRKLANIYPKQGDDRELSYGDNTFDGIYLITVLGEIPDADAALRKMRRVVKPEGRLVIGEFFLDPDFVSFDELCKRTSQAGFTFERKSGPQCAYLARFIPA